MKSLSLRTILVSAAMHCDARSCIDIPSEMRVRNVEPPQRREPFITTTRANNSVSLPTSAVSSSVALLVLELRNMSYFLPDILPNTT